MFDLAHDAFSLNGWAATVGARAVDGFKAPVAGNELNASGVEFGLPGPDVKAIRPWLDWAPTATWTV
jgi:hypothetical protein